jgi:hypothetical protein
MAIYRKEIQLEADASGAASQSPLFCPQCGQRIPGGSKFCFSCGGSLAAGRGVSGPRHQDLAALGMAKPPEHPTQRGAGKGFLVSREDLDARYASMAYDELIALRRGGLTDVARNCVDQELSRRAIISAKCTHPPSTAPRKLKRGIRAFSEGFAQGMRSHREFEVAVGQAERELERMRQRNYRVDRGGSLDYGRAAAQAVGVSSERR